MNNQIQQLLSDNNINYLELNSPYYSPWGRITELATHGFYIDHGAETGFYEDLEGYDLEALTYETERQIRTNRKSYPARMEA